MNQFMKKNSFMFYLSLLYIANLGGISAGYSIYSLDKSLGILGYSETFVGFCTTIPRYVMIILSLFLRKSSDKVNKIKMSIVGALIGIVSFSGLALSNKPIFLILFSAIYGFSYIASLTYMTSMALEYTPQKKRMSVMGIFATSASLGSFFGPWLSNLLFPFGGKTHPNFMLFSGAIFCCMWFVFVLLASIFAKELKKPIAQTPAKEEDLMMVKETKIPRLRIYFPIIPFIFILGLIFSSLVTFINGYAIDNNIDSAEVFLFGFSIVALLIRFFFYKQFATWPKDKILYYGFTSYFVALSIICLFQYMPFKTTLFIAGVFLGAGHGVLYPTLSVLFTDVSPNYTGNASFVFSTCFIIGFLAAPLLGFISDFFGFSAMYITVFIVTGIYLLKSFQNKRLQAIFRHLRKIQQRDLA